MAYHSTLHVLNDGRVDGTLEALLVLSILVLSAAGVWDRVGRGTFTAGGGLGELLLDGLVLSRQEDDL